MIGLIARIILVAVVWYLLLGAVVVVTAIRSTGEEIYFPSWLDWSVVLNGIIIGTLYKLMHRNVTFTSEIIEEEEDDE